MGQQVGGKLEVICGCMFSEKSETLIRRLRRARRYEKKKVAGVKPQVDDRYSAEDISSHAGLQFAAIPVSQARDILDLQTVQTADLVGIDEVQFFDKDIVDVCRTLVAQGKHVIVAGLDMDYRGVPFGSVPYLLAVADEFVKLHAACTICGGRASRSQRVVDSDEQVVIGGASAYEARCLTHWSAEPVFSRLERGVSEEEDG